MGAGDTVVNRTDLSALVKETGTAYKIQLFLPRTHIHTHTHSYIQLFMAVLFTEARSGSRLPKCPSME